MLGFLEIVGLRPQHTAPPPCLWGPELGLEVNSAGSHQELLRSQWQGEEHAQDFGDCVTCCHHQHSAIQEYLFCPLCIPGTVLEVNMIDPNLVLGKHLTFILPAV